MTSPGDRPANAREPANTREIERGILLMAVGMLLIPGIDALAKGLTVAMAAGQIAWSRFLFQTIILAPVVFFTGGQLPRRHYAAHAMRGILIATATLLFFTSLETMPIADAIAIFFVEPLILTLLSALLLGEDIGWRRLSAVLVGFLGAMIIIQPGFADFGYAVVLPLGAAICFAFYLVLTRKLALSTDPNVIQLTAGISGMITMSIALIVGYFAGIRLLDPVWPTPMQWLMMAGLGVVGTTGHLFVVHAFKRAPAVVLAPFQYLEIISASLLGLIFFGDFPSPTTWLGIAIIVGAGLYVFHRERRRANSDADK